MTYKYLRRILLGVTAVGVVVATGYALASSDIANFAAAQEADQHAATAKIVMTRGMDPVPAHDAAFAVVGDTGQTTIEGLRADGTNWDGHVTLRITVSRTPGTLSSQFAVRCYQYTFTRYDADIDRLECPPGPPLVRGPVKPFLVLTDVDARHLAEILDALSPTERVNAGTVQHALAKAHAAPAVVWAVAHPHGIDMEVRAHTQCILATLPTVGPARFRRSTTDPPARVASVAAPAIFSAPVAGSTALVEMISCATDRAVKGYTTQRMTDPAVPTVTGQRSTCGDGPT